MVMPLTRIGLFAIAAVASVLAGRIQAADVSLVLADGSVRHGYHLEETTDGWTLRHHLVTPSGTRIGVTATFAREEVVAVHDDLAAGLATRLERADTLAALGEVLAWAESLRYRDGIRATLDTLVARWPQAALGQRLANRHGLFVLDGELVDETEFLARHGLVRDGREIITVAEAAARAHERRARHARLRAEAQARQSELRERRLAEEAAGQATAILRIQDALAQAALDRDTLRERIANGTAAIEAWRAALVQAQSARAAAVHELRHLLHEHGGRLRSVVTEDGQQVVVGIDVSAWDRRIADLDHEIHRLAAEIDDAREDLAADRANLERIRREERTVRALLERRTRQLDQVRAELLATRAEAALPDPVASGPAPVVAGHDGRLLKRLLDHDNLARLRLIADDGTFLGTLDPDPTAPDSIFNRESPYGGTAHPHSIWNDFGFYGSAISSAGARSPDACAPPSIVDQGLPIGSVTANRAIERGIAPSTLAALISLLIEGEVTFER